MEAEKVKKHVGIEITTYVPSSTELMHIAFRNIYAQPREIYFSPENDMPIIDEPHGSPPPQDDEEE